MHLVCNTQHVILIDRSILQLNVATFFLEWIEGNPNLDGSSFELLWIYLIFMNVLWVVIPLLLLWDSCSKLAQVSVC